MSTSHTPGPWTTRRNDIMANGDPIAVANRLWADDEKTVAANARLIAAAPELLMALRNLLTVAADDGNESSPHWAKQMQGARYAIAKVEGK